MKILYFTQLFYPAVFGGGEYIFYHWAKELAEKGHEIFVITQNLQSESHYEIVDGIKIFRVGSKLGLSGTLPVGIFSNLSYLLKSYYIGNKIIKENNIDLIHSNTYIPVISAQWCANKTKIPHIATVHDVYFTSQKNFWSEWSEQKNTSIFSKILGPYIEKKIAKTDLTLFHTVSEQSKKDLQMLGVQKKIIVIPNGINLCKYQYEKSDKNQIIFVGRLIFYKNLQVVINAFSKVIKEIPSAKLIIVGDGPSKSDLIKQTKSLKLENNVFFKGRVTTETKVQLIKESKILVNPSLIEGFGIVVLEGFACGKPILVSDSKPLSDLVNDGIDGYVLTSNNPDAWAEKIIYLMNNDKQAQQMGLTGRKKVEGNYSITHVTNEISKMYDSIISGE